MRTRIRDARGSELVHDGDAGEDQDRQAENEHGKHGHLHVVGFDLLAEIFRRAAHHQTGDEYSQDDEDDDPVEARADSAEHDFAQHDVDERHHAAEGCERIVHGIHAAAACVSGDGGVKSRIGDSEAHFLAFHVAAGLRGAGFLVDAMEHRVARSFGAVSNHHAGEKQHCHGRPDGPAVLL